MPPKKRTKKSLLQETAEKIEKEIRETRPGSRTTIVEPETAAVDPCNHRNAHYTAGELTCVLPKNHGGDHLGYVNDKPTAWSDAAGKPARSHA